MVLRIRQLLSSQLEILQTILHRSFKVMELFNIPQCSVSGCCFTGHALLVLQQIIYSLRQQCISLKWQLYGLLQHVGLFVQNFWRDQVSLYRVNELRFQWTQLTGRRKWADYKATCNDWEQSAFPYYESILLPSHFSHYPESRGRMFLQNVMQKLFILHDAPTQNTIICATTIVKA
jgi:hypothetical protein